MKICILGLHDMWSINLSIHNITYNNTSRPLKFTSYHIHLFMDTGWSIQFIREAVFVPETAIEGNWPWDTQMVLGGRFMLIG